MITRAMARTRVLSMRGRWVRPFYPNRDHGYLKEFNTPYGLLLGWG